MPHNQRLRITLMQILQQHPQRTLLCLSTCVLWSLAVGSQSADVTYADAVVVEEIDNIKSTGEVKIDGKIWTARSSDNEIIPPNSIVVVEKIEGVKLIVNKK